MKNIILVCLLIFPFAIHAQSWVDGKCSLNVSVKLSDYKDAQEVNKLQLVINQEKKFMADQEDLSFLNDIQRKEFLYNFIMNPDKKDDLAERPDRAVILVRSFGFPKAKKQLIDQIRDVYYLIWSEAAQEKYGKDYVELDCKLRAKIQKKFPYLVIENSKQKEKANKPKFKGPPSFKGDVSDN